MMREYEAAGVRSLAVFSECEQYRYFLRREWGRHRTQPLHFLMLNPSTADERKNDPTVERCQRRAKALGFQSFIVTNLFAFRATDPKAMKAAADPIGLDTDTWIQLAADLSRITICAWGNHGQFLERSAEVRRLLSNYPLFALDITGAGEPRHPLYVPYSLSPVPYRGAAE
jgi:hypothetical protein